MKDRFEQLVERWPSAWVARTEVRRFSGGVIAGKTLANLASRGEAVPPSFRCGKKVCYSTQELADYLRGRERGNA